MILKLNKEKINRPGCIGHVFSNPVTRVGNPGRPHGLRRVVCFTRWSFWREMVREGAPGAQREIESSDTENSPDSLWVYSICQHLISVT